MKTLVAYFSKSGKTAEVAKDIAIILDADTFEIKTEKKYPASYIKTLGVSRKEFNAGERPAITDNIDISQYDRILIGYPIWFGTAPMAVISFAEKHDWTGKEVFPFCTSSVTSIDKSEADLADCMKIRLHKGLRLKNVKDLNKEDILKWTL